MLPIPTNGDTIPPHTNVDAPRSADAVPEYFRSLLSAIVVDAVNVNPIMNNNMKRAIS